MKNRQKGFSLIELLIVVAIILIIAAIAIPSLIHAKMRGNEASAVGSLHAIITASQNYSSTYGKGYPSILATLGPAVIPTASNADLLDSVLASSAKSGYTFSYSAAPAVSGVVNSFTITADPTTRSTTGQRSFYTDQTLIIRSNTTTTASATDPPISQHPTYRKWLSEGLMLPVLEANSLRAARVPEAYGDLGRSEDVILDVPIG